MKLKFHMNENGENLFKPKVWMKFLLKIPKT